jgi:hypothetical protein
MNKQKSWTNRECLELIGKVVNITVGQKELRSVFVENLRLPNTEEGRVLVQYRTDRGKGGRGYIRTRVVIIEPTGEEPVFEKAEEVLNQGE